MRGVLTKLSARRKAQEKYHGIKMEKKIQHIIDTENYEMKQAMRYLHLPAEIQIGKLDNLPYIEVQCSKKNIFREI